MPSVQGAPSIVYYVSAWVSNQCRACGRFIDVVLIPEDGADQFVWENSCPECMLSHPAAQSVANLAQRFRKVREIRRDVGLDRPVLSSPIREALGGPMEMPTMFLSVWHQPPSTRGTRRDGPNDPYLEEYAILGWVWDQEAEALARVPQVDPFPSYRTDSINIGSTELAQASSVLVATVQLAIIAKHPTVSTAEMRFTWNVRTTPKRYDLSIPGAYETPAKNLALLTKAGLQLVDVRATVVGKPGRPSLNRHEIDENLRKLAADYRSKNSGTPGILRFSKMSGMPVTTLKRHLDASSFANWHNYKRRFFSKPPVSRQVRNRPE